MNKDLIQSRFSKNLKNYNENAKIQKRMAEKLFTLVKNKKVKSILEIGCGTGFLTQLTAKYLSFENYTAIDIVEECSSYMLDINSKISFIACDIEDFLTQNDDKYDLIISNASLQWVNDFENVVNTLKSKLNCGGELVFSTFGKENFREIFHLMGTTLKYYSESELNDTFKPDEIFSEIHIMAFSSPKEVLRHLQMTGVNAIENRMWTKKDLTKFENGYKNLCVLRPTLTYNPIYLRFVN